jgi:hypothetical protein
MLPEFLSLTELGTLYGVSRVRMGQWLVEVGLRTGRKTPSERAFGGGYIARRPSSQPRTYFWVWHAAQTIDLLDRAGYGRPGSDGVGPQLPDAPGPRPPAPTEQLG